MNTKFLCHFHHFMQNNMNIFWQKLMLNENIQKYHPMPLLKYLDRKSSKEISRINYFHISIYHGNEKFIMSYCIWQIKCTKSISWIYINEKRIFVVFILSLYEANVTFFLRGLFFKFILWLYVYMSARESLKRFIWLTLNTCFRRLLYTLDYLN